jgi:hypothetical protein
LEEKPDTVRIGFNVANQTFPDLQVVLQKLRDSKIHSDAPESLWCPKPVSVLKISAKCKCKTYKVIAGGQGGGQRGGLPFFFPFLYLPFLLRLYAIFSFFLPT